MSLKLPRPEWNKNSPHRYGIWTAGESDFMDGFLKQVADEFGNAVRFLEIGVAGGATMAGILERCDAIGANVTYEGVDNHQGRPQAIDPLPANCKFTEGDSAEVFPEVGDNFNILFIDACHCVNHVMLDFLHYSPRLVTGGYCLFHDARETDWQGKHYQGHGPKIPSFSIGVREGLKKLGLLQGYRKDWQFIREIKDTDIMGMMVYRKMLAL